MSSAFSRLPAMHHQRGFSLIEVIAAFLIFAVGFGVLLQILTSSLNMAHRSQQYSEAALWAQSKLDVVGVGEPIKEGTENGRFNDDYRWSLAISPWQPPDTDPGIDENVPIDLYRLDLTVLWGAAGHPHKVHFITLRAVKPDPNDTHLSGLPGRQRPRSGSGGHG